MPCPGVPACLCVPPPPPPHPPTPPPPTPMQRLTKYFKGGNEEERSYKVTTPTLV